MSQVLVLPQRLWAVLPEFNLQRQSPINPQQVEQILESTADDIGTPGWDAHSGWGRVNAYRAVVRARGFARDSIPPALAFISPTPNATVSGMVNITLNASDNVGIK